MQTWWLRGDKAKARAFADTARMANEEQLQNPYFMSPGWLKVDPTWADLRGNPRFERLVKG